MTSEEEYKNFITNESKMNAYREAINTLREIGFEKLLRKLGEPLQVDMANPRSLEISGMVYSQSVGYYDAVDSFFDVLSLEQAVVKQGEQSPDFGAKDKLEELGYADE